MTPAELAAAGRALYGERWQTQLSHDLQVSDRTVRRWLAGKSPIPGDAERRLHTVLEKRAAELGSLVQYTVNPMDHTVFHTELGASFRYEDAGNVTLVHQGFAEAAALPLIAQAAKEAVRRWESGNPHAAFAADGQSGRCPAAVGSLHGFMRGSVVVPNDVDLTAPIVDEPLDAEGGELHR